MPDSRVLLKSLVPIFLLAQALVVQWVAAGERPPSPPALLKLPSEVGAWRQTREDPIASEVAAQLKADQLLSRVYVHTSTGSVASLFIAWFRSQRAGASQPHSPKVCLPGSGWTPLVSGEVTLDTAAGAITINRYIVVNRGQSDVVLYWYQGPHRVTAGEWESKVWVMVDAFREKRTDMALVRVVVPLHEGGAAEATAAATRFTQSLYPMLVANLPQ